MFLMENHYKGELLLLKLVPVSPEVCEYDAQDMVALADV